MVIVKGYEASSLQCFPRSLESLLPCLWRIADAVSVELPSPVIDQNDIASWPLGSELAKAMDCNRLVQSIERLPVLPS